MNVNDSERFAGLLEYAGYEPLEKLDVVDVRNTRYADLGVVLVNTCSVRAASENKALHYLASLAPFKKMNPKLIVGLCGCVSSHTQDDIKKKYPFVDIVIGPGEVAKLAEFLGVKAGRQAPKRGSGPTAWVTIMEGCDNFCAYCVVPYVRGRERSRPVGDILGEIRGLDRYEYPEVALLGQNVNSFKSTSGGPLRAGLAGLLREVHKIDWIKRIRFLTSHPKDMSDDIISAVKELEKVCEYFHLPLQSGDDQVLKAMNRGYTSGYYRKLVEQIRLEIPDAAITSDAIAGFPGETDKQFENTCGLIEELELDLVNTAAYSVRPGTSAAKLKGQLTEKAKKERLERLMEVCERTALKKNRRLSGSTLEVLADRPGQGRTRGNKIVKFNGGTKGGLFKVRISGVSAYVLKGEVV